jgi:SnoaL-like domain
MTRMGSPRFSLRMQPGTARVSVGSKAKIFSFAIHYSLNGQIYVDGDVARAQWYLFMPCTVVDGNRAMWRASIDHERYRRVDGTWLFSEKRSQPLMNVPFEEGWEQRGFV